LQGLQQLSVLVRFCIQAKKPSHSAIIQANQAIHPYAPLGLEAQEHFKRRPVVVPHLKVLTGRCVFKPDDTKHGSIIRGLVVNGAAGPMLSGLDQFFLLAPWRLLK
jgi:hypothetical protein